MRMTNPGRGSDSGHLIDSATNNRSDLCGPSFKNDLNLRVTNKQGRRPAYNDEIGRDGAVVGKLYTCTWQWVGFSPTVLELERPEHIR